MDRIDGKGFHMSRKVRYNLLGKTLTLAGIMAIANACHKDPTPQPQPEPTPTDTVQPIVPHYPDTVYVPFEWGIRNPNMDTIRFYADKPEVKKIIMDLAPMDSLYTSGWTWRIYDMAVDTLNKRCELSPKVIGRGTIIAERVIPDGIHNASGMPRSDSIAFRRMGFDIYSVFSRGSHQ